ncbi:MAG: phosphodiesterase [Pseudomonadota bacterium]
MLKFVVISDLHLVPEGALSRGIDTGERLERAIAHVNALHSDAAFCVFAGDLTDDGDVPSYRRLASMLEDLKPPCWMTLGNHDNRPAFLEVFDETQLSSARRVDLALDAKGYRVILLDTMEEGTDAGILRSEQINWLEGALDHAAGKPVVVVLHHPICALGTPLDTMCLQDPAPLLAALRRHGDVRQVISGHVHMSATGSCEGIPFTTISGNHYSMAPRLGGPISSMPRMEGPGQIGVVLAWPDRVVVHHESFFDRHLPDGPLHGSTGSGSIDSGDAPVSETL